MNPASQTTSAALPETTHLRAIRDAFDRFVLSGEFANEPAWLVSLRKRGLARFLETGYPTRDSEHWRHTSLEGLVSLPFSIAGNLTSDDRITRLLDGWVFGPVAQMRMVFVNGRFAPALSNVRAQQNGVYLANFGSAVRDEPEVLRPCLTEEQELDGDGRVSALNMAFARDGATVIVPANSVVSVPIYLLFVSVPRSEGETTNVRNVIVAGANSRLTVVEHYVGLSPVRASTNTVTHLVAGDGSIIEYIKLQDEDWSAFHLATLQAKLQASSNVTCHSFALGGGLARQHILATLAGERANAAFNGLYLGRRTSLIDHYLWIDHAERACTSNELFNGILTGNSTGVFYGRIRVRPGAQKTDAKQTNKNLVLSDAASVYTRPQLEIYADDVKCTHGATVGQLDSESIFYLRSRGLSEKTAQQMLVHAFAGEIIEQIRFDPARSVLDRLLYDRIDQALQTGG